MKSLNKFIFKTGICFIATVPSVQADVTYTDNFTTPFNYLSNGLAGRIWDGVYFGAGEFANSGLGSGGRATQSNAMPASLRPIRLRFKRPAPPGRRRRRRFFCLK